jgi:hypothetical protein
MQYIFFTGVPGSRWSGVSQVFRDKWSDVDNSDLTPDKTYMHHLYKGHTGNYYGPGMLNGKWLDKTFGTRLQWEEEIKNSYAQDNNIKLILSHNFAYYLNDITNQFPECPIVLCYRDDIESFEWWHQAGGWDITYPNYDWYKDDSNMRTEIQKQNKCILEFVAKHNLKLEQPNKDFFREYFSRDIDFEFPADVKVAVYV